MVVDACTNFSTALGFFDTVETLHIHFSRPGLHAELKKNQESLSIKFGELHSLSETRWACRFENCRAIINNYEDIKTVLEDEASSRQSRSVESIGLLNSISKRDFTVCLFILNYVLGIINIVSKYFQSKNATLGQSAVIIKSTIATFEADRINAESFTKLWEEIEKFAQDQEISLEPLRTSKRRRNPNRFDDFIVDSTLGKRNESDNSQTAFEYWKINAYFVILDNVIHQLKNRFQNLPFA